MAQRGRGVFAISVAGEMVSMGVQHRRGYDRRGLVAPARTSGGSRLYSPADIDRLHRIRELLADGLNLAGIAHVLALEERVATLERQLAARTARPAQQGPGSPSSSRQPGPR